ncbi:MAG: phosphotransferase enzyme family protein [Candidatus Nanosalina sp. J07AB43]|nr:MAG: phosphotransferase enzyme family protein [Candidatus Nanosalina sp. J07AB43]
MKQVSEKDVTEAINQLDPENHIEEKEDISGHNNKVFRIKLEERTVICKFCTGENSIQDCRKEVNMNQLLKNQTTVDTPEILYSNSSTRKNKFPFFIIEYIERESLQDSFTELSSENQVEVVEQAVKC